MIPQWPKDGHSEAYIAFKNFAHSTPDASLALIYSLIANSNRQNATAYLLSPRLKASC